MASECGLICSVGYELNQGQGEGQGEGSIIFLCMYSMTRALQHQQRRTRWHLKSTQSINRLITVVMTGYE